MVGTATGRLAIGLYDAVFLQHAGLYHRPTGPGAWPAQYALAGAIWAAAYHWLRYFTLVWWAYLARAGGIAAGAVESPHRPVLLMLLVLY